jgi:hypothetical protein
VPSACLFAGMPAAALVGLLSVASVTAERVAAVQAHIADAVSRTSADSTLPELEQDKLLAQSCVEACDLLKDWLDDPWWDAVRPSRDGPVAEFVPVQREFAKFLGPMLKAALAEAVKYGMSIPEWLVDEAHEKVTATARRLPRMRRRQLFEEARIRVASLQREICGLSAQMSSGIHSATALAADAASRQKVRKALGKVSGVLLAVALAMAGAGPHAAAQNVAEWGNAGIRAVEVITVHYLADRAQPSLRVAPPRAGPQLRR